MELFEKTLSSELIFKGSIIEVNKDEVLLANGKKCTKEVVKHQGAVAVVALTEKNEVVFVSQMRHPLGKEVLEIPAGKIENNTEPLVEIKRELKEETGAIGENYLFLGKLYPTPAYSNEVISLYFCKVNEWQAPQPDDTEVLNIKKIEFEKAIEMVMKNEIKDAKTQTALLKTYKLMQENKI